MAFKMKIIAILSFLITIACVFLHVETANGVALTLAITFGTIAYHFIMRLGVGTVVNLLLHNHVDCNRRWFQVSDLELKFYKKLKVKSWKNKMPTYDDKAFDSKNRSWDEIAQAMCQSELVHEIIVVLSFVPIFATKWFGAVAVFVTTSILAACFDTMFVIIQRYNRPRIIKMIKKL